jgi:hypothetical protein
MIRLIDPTLGMGNDEPDNMSVRGNTLFVSLRASGQLAIVKVNFSGHSAHSPSSRSWR